MLECGQPKTHQIQSHGGEPRGLSIISTSKKQRKFFGIHHRISAEKKKVTSCYCSQPNFSNYFYYVLLT